jgi:hypothetical protein
VALAKMMLSQKVRMKIRENHEPILCHKVSEKSESLVRVPCDEEESAQPPVKLSPAKPQLRDFEGIVKR